MEQSSTGQCELSFSLLAVNHFIYTIRKYHNHTEKLSYRTTFIQNGTHEFLPIFVNSEVRKAVSLMSNRRSEVTANDALPDGLVILVEVQFEFLGNCFKVIFQEGSACGLDLFFTNFPGFYKTKDKFGGLKQESSVFEDRVGVEVGPLPL